MGWAWAKKQGAVTICAALLLVLLNGCLFGHCAGNGEGYPGNCGGGPNSSANASGDSSGASGASTGASVGGSGYSSPIYYEQDPSYQCTPDGGTAQPSYRAAISHEGDQYFQLGDACHPTTHQLLTTADVDTSYDGNLLGYQAGIYELMNKPGDKPALQAWCVSPDQHADFRARVNADATHEPAALYLQSETLNALFTFTVAFQSDSTAWEYLAHHLELTISQSPSATKPGQHDGSLELLLYGVTTSQNVECRVLPSP